MAIDLNTLKQAVYPIVGACHEVHTMELYAPIGYSCRSAI